VKLVILKIFVTLTPCSLWVIYIRNICHIESDWSVYER